LPAQLFRQPAVSVLFLKSILSLIKILLMENYQPHLRKTVSYYQLLLQRYARRLVLDETVASNIVQEVLECQYYFNSLVPSKHLRQVLRADVLNYCYYHIQAKMFDRPVIKVPLRNLLKTIETDEQTERLIK
jgi:hypothetical protein